jgi:hypothetical protein
LIAAAEIVPAARLWEVGMGIMRYVKKSWNSWMDCDPVEAWFSRRSEEQIRLVIYAVTGLGSVFMVVMGYELLDLRRACYLRSYPLDVWLRVPIGCFAVGTALFWATWMFTQIPDEMKCPATRAKIVQAIHRFQRTKKRSDR